MHAAHGVAVEGERRKVQLAVEEVELRITRVRAEREAVESETNRRIREQFTLAAAEEFERINRDAKLTPIGKLPAVVEALPKERRGVVERRGE